MIRLPGPKETGHRPLLVRHQVQRLRLAGCLAAMLAVADESESAGADGFYSVS
jgi:hypothetical protein